MKQDRPGNRPANDEAIHVSAQDARGGEIILRTRRRRMIFIVGLVGIVLLVAIMRIAAWA